MQIRGLFSSLPFLVIVGGLAAGAQAAVVIVKDTSVVDVIPGLSNFQTFGDQMSGMQVTATFSVAGAQSATWGTTGVGAGGAFTTDWSLTESGDTFASPWTFTFLGTDLGALLSLELVGTPGLTVFDTTVPTPGTPGSAEGADYTGPDATVTYRNVISVGGAPFVGDTFHALFIDYGEQGPLSSFTFTQDTDNDARITQTPEPAGLGLLGLTLAGFGIYRLRRAA